MKRHKRKRGKSSSLPAPNITLEVGMRVRIHPHAHVFGGSTGFVVSIADGNARVRFMKGASMPIAKFDRELVSFDASIPWEGNTLEKERTKALEDNSRQCVRAGAFELVDIRSAY